MTEDDAKTKWCPMFRRYIGMDPAGLEHRVVNNRDDVDQAHLSQNCIGSECMAWREIEPELNNIDSEQEDTGTVITFVFVPNGYCGLAGESD